MWQECWGHAGGPACAVLVGTVQAQCELCAPSAAHQPPRRPYNFSLGCPGTPSHEVVLVPIGKCCCGRALPQLGWASELYADTHARLWRECAPALGLIQRLSPARARAGEDVHKVLWLKSRNSEVWLERRTTYTRSCAVMSMVCRGRRAGAPAAPPGAACFACPGLQRPAACC